MKLKKKMWMMGGLSALALALIPTVISCSATNQPDTKIKDPNLDKTKSKLSNEAKAGYLANVWNTQSAEKDAMSLTQFNSAKKAFDAMKTQENIVTNKVTSPKNSEKYMKVENPETDKFIPVVFMDIDETVLNNFAFQNWILLNGTSYSSAVWREFVAAKKSTEIKGAFDFIRYVWDNGGVVLYNSNRDQDQWQVTKENMIALGLEEKYLPDYTSWMSGVDLSIAKPWSVTKRDDKNKIVKSEKEDRMNLVSSNKAFDLSDSNGGNAVKFRTIMRIGDNFDDFNDNASKGKTNSERIKLLAKIGKLFGNFDKNIKGIKFTKDASKNLQEANEEWAESYIMIGGNTSYGGFESGIKDKWFTLTDDEKIEALNTILKGLLWEGPAKK